MNYTGEGIMSQINSLVAPPQTSSSSGGGKKDPSGYKKTGRSHKDVCVACTDGGDMLSCERCSATMHSLCADPPIDEEEARPIRWTCRSCQYTVSCFNLPNENLTKSGKKKVGKKKADPQAALVPQQQSELNMKTMQASDSKMDRNTPIRNIFDLLMPELRKLNPCEFSLPSDFPTYDHQFPGSSRQLYKKSANAKPKPLVIEEADIGTSLKRKVFCFHCSKSCRLKPLIKCDFCSAYYHFDCLNPPLMTAPVGIWQCPLHVEPFLESNTLETTKLSERVRLWEKVTEPINTTAVIAKFFRKTFNPNPLFHHKIEINRNKTAEVPDYVIGLYDSNFYNSDDEDNLNGDILIGKNTKIVQDHLHNEFMKKSTETLNVSDDFIRKTETKLTPLEVLAKIAEEMDIVEKALEGLDLTTIKQLATRELLKQRWEGESKTKAESPNPPGKVTDNKKSADKLHPLHTTYTKMRPVLSLVCINSMKKITIRSRSVSIGTGDAVTVDLSKMTSCRGVSVRHAVISYDNLQCRWELVNYSPNGTAVDDCFLGCDFTPELREPNKFADSPEYSLKKYLMDRNKMALKFYSKSESVGSFQNCKCLQSTIPSLRTCEGPIPLKAKSRIKIGCVALLVTTTDYVEDEVKSPLFKPYPVERHEKKVRLDNALTQCLPPRPEDGQSTISNKSAINPTKVTSHVMSKSGKHVQITGKPLKSENTKSTKGNKLTAEKELQKAKPPAKGKDVPKEKVGEAKKKLQKVTPMEIVKDVSLEKPLDTVKGVTKPETVTDLSKVMSGTKMLQKGTQEFKKEVQKINLQKGTITIRTEKSPDTKKELSKGKALTKEGNSLEKKQVNVRKVDDKGKDISGLPPKKLATTMKVKRQVVISGRSMINPYAQPRLIPPLSKLVPLKMSPKKLVNYFDTTKKPEIIDVKGKTEPELAKKPEKETSESVVDKSKLETTEVEIIKTIPSPQTAIKQNPKRVIEIKHIIDHKVNDLKVSPVVPSTSLSSTPSKIVSASKISPPKTTPPKTTPPKTTPSKTTPPKVSPPKTSPPKTSPSKTSPSIATKFGPVFKP